jgi:hypothetical protein
MTSNTVIHWRAEWARYANHALTLANSPARIDHRSLKAQGIDREPTQHQGPKAFAMQAVVWLLTGSAG